MIPKNIQAYLENFMTVTRFQVDMPGIPYGPPARTADRFTDAKLKFLADVAQAAHNLFRPDGVVFFYNQAKLINTAWGPHKHLLEDGRGVPFYGLLPLPEADIEAKVDLQSA